MEGVKEGRSGGRLGNASGRREARRESDIDGGVVIQAEEGSRSDRNRVDGGRSRREVVRSLAGSRNRSEDVPNQVAAPVRYRPRHSPPNSRSLSTNDMSGRRSAHRKEQTDTQDGDERRETVVALRAENSPKQLSRSSKTAHSRQQKSRQLTHDISDTRKRKPLGDHDGDRQPSFVGDKRPRVASEIAVVNASTNSDTPRTGMVIKLNVAKNATPPTGPAVALRSNEIDLTNDSPFDDILGTDVPFTSEDVSIEDLDSLKVGEDVAEELAALTKNPPECVRDNIPLSQLKDYGFLSMNNHVDVQDMDGDDDNYDDLVDYGEDVADFMPVLGVEPTAENDLGPEAGNGKETAMRSVDVSGKSPIAVEKRAHPNFPFRYNVSVAAQKRINAILYADVAVAVRSLQMGVSRMEKEKSTAERRCAELEKTVEEKITLDNAHVEELEKENKSLKAGLEQLQRLYEDDRTGYGDKIFENEQRMKVTLAGMSKALEENVVLKGDLEAKTATVTNCRQQAKILVARIEKMRLLLEKSQVDIPAELLAPLPDERGEMHVRQE
ncbi:hypothetical protein ACHQM5_014663 [Ranunculus cassubicifolius]